MTTEIIMNCKPYETRVALIENGQVAEYYLERARDKGIVGNIYKATVKRVLPGMQSAFVDLGLERAAFLYAGDIIHESLSQEEIARKAQNVHLNSDSDRVLPIRHLVKEGQEIVVQVSKDAMGTKGARVTTYVSLPGRYVVLMPTVRHVGISRKIQSEEERSRLKRIVDKLRPKHIGIIVRTASQGVDDEKLEKDIEFLLKLWENIQNSSKTDRAPSCIYEDLNLAFRSTRDLLSKDIDRIVLDNKEQYLELVHFLNRFSVKLGAQVQLYEGTAGIFEAYGVDLEVKRALQQKVWLKSGGYIIIQQTEALIAIDVNTGRYVGNKNFGQTIVQTNLEAVKEICLQLRLRNMGGIIILDFIDMDRDDDKNYIFKQLIETLKADKAKTSVLKISDMGLVQMTRKRTEESLSHKISSICPYCKGTGSILSPITVSCEALRELERAFSNPKHDRDAFLIRAHPEVADRLCEEDAPFVTDLKDRYQKRLMVKNDETMHIEEFEVIPLDL